MKEGGHECDPGSDRRDHQGTELLWSGIGQLYGWRVYRDVDSTTFIRWAGMYSRRHRHFSKVNPADAPANVRAMYETLK